MIDPVGIAAVITAIGTLGGVVVTARHVGAQARQVKVQTQTDPMTAANSALVQALAETRADVARLREDQDRDRARMCQLETEARADRHRLRDALDILGGPVIVVLDWLDSGAEPPVPHESASHIRERIRALRSDLAD